jgi:AAA15 family ATPase/GTPase
VILEFRTKNFKSFSEELVFSMVPAPKQTGLDYSVRKEIVGSKEYKGLCSAIIYGPNASGKTNIIGAIDTMKAIVLRGNIRNTNVLESPNSAAATLELIPNCNEENPITEFAISFINKGFKIDYSFIIDIGQFAENNHKRSIIEEKLSINEKTIFSRGKELELLPPSWFSQFLNTSGKINKSILDIASSSLIDEELFLCNGFKSIISKQIADLIMNWFSRKLITIYRSDLFEVIKPMEGHAEKSIIIDKTLTEAAKAFGVYSNAIGFRKESETTSPEMISIVEKKDVALRSRAFESYGTLRFINEFPTLAETLSEGCTLVVDEFDASIHPMALMSIINIFHNDDINTENAQLIFNTHNPIFLDSSLFRRDEIKFVERDKNTHNSVHYSLSDFRTADGVRKGESYMKNYFMDRYGAIEDIDFTSVFEKVLKKREAQEKND